MKVLYEICVETLEIPGINVTDPHYRIPFEMREVEGGLCEFDKFSRIFKNEGRTRSIYNYSQKDRPLIEDIEEGESRWENLNNS
jgi:hypothetical protein